MEEVRKEYHRRVIIVLNGELDASNRLEAIKIVHVQSYYYTQGNDCDQEAVHEIADRICVAGRLRCQAKHGFTGRFRYAFTPSLPRLNKVQGGKS